MSSISSVFAVFATSVFAIFNSVAPRYWAARRHVLPFTCTKQVKKQDHFFLCAKKYLIFSKGWNNFLEVQKTVNISCPQEKPFISIPWFQQRSTTVSGLLPRSSLRGCGTALAAEGPLPYPQYKQERSRGTRRAAERRCKVHPGFCFSYSAATEQSGSNLPSSCSHQQTVYCKKVAGSKAKCHPELKVYLKKKKNTKTEAVHAYEKSTLHMKRNHIPFQKAKSLLNQKLLNFMKQYFIMLN